MGATADGPQTSGSTDTASATAATSTTGRRTSGAVRQARVRARDHDRADHHDHRHQRAVAEPGDAQQRLPQGRPRHGQHRHHAPGQPFGGRPGRRQRAARDPHHQHPHGCACQPQNGVGRPCRKRRDHRGLRGMALGTTRSFSHSRQTPSSIDSRADVLPSRTGRAAGGTGCSGGGPAGRHRCAGGVVRIRRLRDAAGVGRDAAAADRARAGPVRRSRGLDLAGPCDLDRTAGGRLRRAPAADRATGGGADRGGGAVQRGRDPAVAVRPGVGLGGGGRGARCRPVRVPRLADLDRGDLGCPVPRRPHAQARGHRLAVPDGDLVLQGRRSPRRLRLPAAARGVRRRCRPGRRRRRNGVHLPAAAVCAADDVRRLRRRPLADRLAHGRLPGGRGAGVGSGNAHQRPHPAGQPATGLHLLRADAGRSAAVRGGDARLPLRRVVGDGGGDGDRAGASHLRGALSCDRGRHRTRLLARAPADAAGGAGGAGRVVSGQRRGGGLDLVGGDPRRTNGARSSPTPTSSCTTAPTRS